MIFNERNASYIINDCFFSDDSIETDEEIIIENSYVFLSRIITDGNIVANHDLIVFGNVKAGEIKVKGNLICFSDIESDSLEVGYDLKCFGNFDCASVFIGGSAFIEEGIVKEVIVEKNIFINRSIELVGELEVNGNVFCNEGILGNGILKAKNSIVSEYCALECGSIQTNLINLEEYEAVKARDEHKPGQVSIEDTSKQMQAMPNANDIDNDQILLRQLKDNGSVLNGYLNAVSNLKKKLTAELSTSEEMYSYEEILDFIRILSDTFLEFDIAHSFFVKILKLSELSKVEKLTNFLDLVYIKDLMPSCLKRISIVEDSFDILIEQNRNRIMDMKVDIKEHSDLINYISIADNCKDFFNDQEYASIMDKLYGVIGVSFETVKRFVC